MKLNMLYEWCAGEDEKIETSGMRNAKNLDSKTLQKAMTKAGGGSDQKKFQAKKNARMPSALGGQQAGISLPDKSRAGGADPVVASKKNAPRLRKFMGMGPTNTQY